MSKASRTRHRGIDWRRDGDSPEWYNPGLKRWIAWSPGSDAPPLPPRWEQELAGDVPDQAEAASAGRSPRTGAVRGVSRASGQKGGPKGPAGAGGPGRSAARTEATAPTGAPIRRAPWKSPYRLVPIAIALAVVGIGVAQALGTHAPSPFKREATQARQLVGKCLGKASGATDASARGLSPKPVSCTSSRAAVKVLSSHPYNSGTCPAGTQTVSFTFAGVRHPHLECVRELS